MINWKKVIKKVVIIREFEKVIQALYHTDCIQSPVHLSIGQELLSTLVGLLYIENDHVVGNYRSHAISLALTEDYRPLILELLGKRSGLSGGKAGSMHLSVPEKNLMWTSAIVGSGVPIATGIAEALKRNKTNNIVTVMFGDGAVEEGCVLESLNIASIFELPILFLLEDNDLAIHTKKKNRTSVTDYCQLAAAYNIKTMDGTYKDPKRLLEILEAASNYVRLEQKPCFLRVACYRWVEHVGVGNDWHLGYRNISELEQWQACDIIENPEMIGINPYLVQRYSEWCYNHLLKMFRECQKEENPIQRDLLNNVY